jgi:hypothetical protein
MPSTQPALELIALAQLSPDQARQRLRTLLLANPNYFGKVPPSSFMAVLKIQEDTTYECISKVGYDSQSEQLIASIEIKQAFGYTGDAFIHGSEESVRFYLSFDGGSSWLDQGMRSLTVFDVRSPRPLAQRVTLEVISAEDLCSQKTLPKIRAILSWNSPPPAGAPNWTPVWGNVVESDLQFDDSQVDVKNGQRSFKDESRHHRSATLHSDRTDPQHSFLAFVLAKAAAFGFSAPLDPGLDRIDRDETATEILFPSAKPTISAVL